MKPLQALLVALGVGLGITLLVKSFECANNKRDSGQNVAIIVQLHSNNRTKMADTYNGDVTCSSQ